MFSNFLILQVFTIATIVMKADRALFKIQATKKFASGDYLIIKYKQLSIQVFNYRHPLDNIFN